VAIVLSAVVAVVVSHVYDAPLKSWLTRMVIPDRRTRRGANTATLKASLNDR
jgi:hypothetical protein